MADVELADALPLVGGLQTKTYEITTGAAPVDFTLPDSTIPRIILSVTTGGTAGDEAINLVLPALTNGGNAEYIGVCIVIVLADQTDPADVVIIKRGGAAGGQFYNPITHFVQVPTYSRLALAYAGAAVCMRWIYDDWRCDFTATDWQFDYVANSTTLYIQAPDGGTVNFQSPRVTMSALPSADPVAANELWNSTETVKISAGP